MLSGVAGVGKTQYISKVQGRDGWKVSMSDFLERSIEEPRWRKKNSSVELSAMYVNNSWFKLMEAMAHKWSIVDRHPTDDIICTHHFAGSFVPSVNVYEETAGVFPADKLVYPKKMCQVILIDGDATANTLRRRARDNGIDAQLGDDFVHHQNVLFLQLARKVPVNNRFVIVGPAWNLDILEFVLSTVPEPGVLYSTRQLDTLYGMKLELLKLPASYAVKFEHRFNPWHKGQPSARVPEHDLYKYKTDFLM